MKRVFKRPKHGAAPAALETLSDAPMREFVYLDEVSLRSLLSSQTGEMTESKSEQSMDALEAELSATLSANPGLVAKAELGSRFQTSNSSTIQTSRKATVQSWFREFHGLQGLRLIEPVTPERPATDPESLASIEDASVVVVADKLRRGALVEFKIRLKADPVFHLGTMVSEFSAMAEDYPEMFAGENGLETLREVQPINKILQRLLAGLIPIRAEAVDYSVVEIDDIERVVHNKLLDGLAVQCRPLEIVGVTEHLAYWKDIRRVLFSEAEFTLMGRVTRDGLYDTWTPVKLADLFHEVAPDLVAQINAASQAPLGTPQLTAPMASAEVQLNEALVKYVDALLGESGKKLVETQQSVLDAKVALLQKRAGSVSDQRTAFREVRDTLVGVVGVDVDVAPERDLELREAARRSAGLSLFPALGSVSTVSEPTPTPTPDPPSTNVSPRLLDVEVIAIYW